MEASVGKNCVKTDGIAGAAPGATTTKGEGSGDTYLKSHFCLY